MRNDLKCYPYQITVQGKSNIYNLTNNLNRKCITFQIDKKPKKVKTMYKNLDYAPNYNPDHEYVRKQLGSCGSKFETYKGRQPIHRIATAASEKFFFQDDVKSFDKSSKLAVRVQTPNFTKSRPRYLNPSSKLPSFMQKRSGNRNTLYSMNDKMIELNNFMEGRFQTLITGFGLKKRAKKRIEFEDDDFFDMELAGTRPQTMMGQRGSRGGVGRP